MQVVRRLMEHVLPLRVYYEDTDAGGVVYYANYLKFMERARTEWLRSLGFEQDQLLAAEGIVFAVRSAKIDYLRPARFNDALQVCSRITERTRASLVFHQSVERGAKDGFVLCQADIRIVCVTADTMRPRPIPERIIMEISGDN